MADFIDPGPEDQSVKDVAVGIRTLAGRSVNWPPADEWFARLFWGASGGSKRIDPSDSAAAALSKGIMNKICIHSLVGLAGALGCVALADETVDSPSRELLKSYTYQPAELALPAADFSAAANPAVFEPTVAPDFEMKKPTQYDWRALKEAMADSKDGQSHALFAWDWRWNAQWHALERPDIETLNVAWSPLTPQMEATLSPASIDSASEKVQVRFPLISLAW